MPRKRAYHIAVAQLRVDDEDMELNACGILEALDLAAAETADFLVTPEAALTGYHGRFDKPRRDGLARLMRDGGKDSRLGFAIRRSAIPPQETAI